MGAGGSVLASADGGSTWTPVLFNPSEKEGIYALAVDRLSRAVYAAGGENLPDAQGPSGIICRSRDQGLHWTKVFTATSPIRSIAVDYQKEGVVYATDDNGEAYKSIDAGDHWSVIRESPKSGMKAVLALDPRVPSHAYLADYRYVGESVDGGLTWSGQNGPLSQGLPDMFVATLAVDGGSATQTMWAGASGVWVLRRPAPQPGEPATVTVDANPPGAPAGQSVRIIGLITDQHDNWVADGTVVEFTASGAGSVGPASVTAPTVGGRASVWLNSVRVGAATVTVTAGSAVGTLTVEFAPWPAEIWLPWVRTGHQ